ncbi:MAG: hypothetical protein DLM57_18240 [Pseudonocardiales bacterium]|nr:MAG: hypothetical protein DLM57_18240 [Pseudonocardiales bacterium]
MTRSTRVLRISCAALSVTCLLGVAACSGGHHKKAVSSSAVNPTAKKSVAPQPQPKPAPKPLAFDPLVGGKQTSGSVVAVKIDDTANGRPQVGIDKADIVYIEQVEGGLTRTIAVFHSRKPVPVGPVRSVRANDPELLTQYGRIAFVASGGGGDSLPALDNSVLRADINDRGGPGFFRDDNRPVPYNLMLDMTKLPPTFGAGAQSIGFTWSASKSGLKGTPIAAQLHTMVGGTPVQFIWSSGLHRFVRVIDGAVQRAADGATIATPNVIVQFCKGHVNPHDVDQAGNPGFFTESIGSGRVAVYRDGHRVDGSWSRKSAASGTALKDKYGRAIPLAPGGAWVVLVDTAAPLG